MHHPVRGKENSLHQKEGAQLRVHLTVKYLGHSPGGNKVPVLIVLLLFKEMEGSGRGKGKVLCYYCFSMQNCDEVHNSLDLQG